MKRYLLLLLLATAASAQQDSITLDPEAMSEVWAQVAGAAAANSPGAPVLKLNPVSAVSTRQYADLFREAQQAISAPTFPVLVLSLLQQLNPQLPMEKNVWAYAAALELHRQAFTGNARARAELCAALCSGKLSGLNYFTDAALAAELAGSSE